MEGVDQEIDSLKKEYRWILKEEVKSVLQELHAVLTEACSRFPVNLFPGEDHVLKPEKFVLSSPTGSQHIKCMLTLLAETICEADITFKLSKQQSPYLTKITPDAPWRLSQIQDAGNYLFHALALVDDNKENTFKTGKQIQHLMKSLTESLNKGRSCLAMPKRKTMEDLLQNQHMKCLKPGLPKDVVASFYVQAQKIILCLYKLNVVSANQVDIVSRHQVECSVPWLNDTLVFFTLALQLCQQLQDKLAVFMQYEAELETDLLPSHLTTPATDENRTLIALTPTDSKTTEASGSQCGDNLLTAIETLSVKGSKDNTTHSTSSSQGTKQDLLIDFS